MPERIRGAGSRITGPSTPLTEESQVPQEQTTSSSPPSSSTSPSPAQSTGARAHATEARGSQDLKQAAIQSELLNKVPAEGTPMKKVLSGKKEGEKHSVEWSADKSKSNLAGFGAQTPYGTGKTLLEGQVGLKTLQGSITKGKDHEIKGEAAAAQGRLRGYRYDDGIGLGVQGESTLVRAGVGGNVDKGIKAKGREVVGAGGSADVGTMVGGRGGLDGGIHLSKVGLPSVGVGGEAFAGARADAKGGLEGRLVGLSAGVDGTASASAGAEAKAEARVSPGGVQASAGAFAGGRAGVSGSANVLGIGVTGSAEVMAGAGAKAQLQAGIKDGKLSIKVGAGAAWGIGGATSVGFSWDIAKTFTDVKRFAGNTEAFLKERIPAVVQKINDPHAAGALAARSVRQIAAGA